MSNMAIRKCTKCDKDWFRRVYETDYCEEHANEVEKNYRRNYRRSSIFNKIVKIVGFSVALIVGLIFISQYLIG
ncbi:MAG: hypothetical protein QQN62_00375 [Nitrosopumilus sp.]|nr:hypothetical protein [Nitrososphaerota archaeon]